MLLIKMIVMVEDQRAKEEAEEKKKWKVKSEKELKTWGQKIM